MPYTAHPLQRRLLVAALILLPVLLIACAGPAAAPTDDQITDEPAVELTAEPSATPTRTPPARQTAPSAAPRASRTPDPSNTPAAVQETAMPAAPRSPQTRAAVADLAARLNLPPDQIEVVSEEEVTWPDGSLGCPQPGMMYTMALVDGMRIVLRAQGRDYSYHSGGNSDPFLCAGPGGSLIDPNVTPKGGGDLIPPPGLPDS